VVNRNRYLTAESAENAEKILGLTTKSTKGTGSDDRGQRSDVGGWRSGPSTSSGLEVGGSLDFELRIAKPGTRPKGGSPKDNFGFKSD